MCWIERESMRSQQRERRTPLCGQREHDRIDAVQAMPDERRAGRAAQRGHRARDQRERHGTGCGITRSGGSERYREPLPSGELACITASVPAASLVRNAGVCMAEASHCLQAEVGVNRTRTLSEVPAGILAAAAQGTLCVDRWFWIGGQGSSGGR